MSAMSPEVEVCEGPLLWHDAPEESAILECTQCDYVVTTGNWNHPSHANAMVWRAA